MSPAVSLIPVKDKRVEDERIRALQMYQILDTATEKAFDDLTELAATICDSPISLVSFVDKDRQWFKAHHGLASRETPRDKAFCAHAIEGSDVMIVEDALNDQRFRQNPLVTGSPNIRFYAGAPLKVDNGHALGTLCVIDRKPRSLSTRQLNALNVLRDAVVSQLELRRAAQEIEALTSSLAVCAWCKRIRETNNGHDRWCSLHDYLSTRTPVSHGICPDCRDSLPVDA